MLKKIRWRFIMSAMIATSVVMLAIVIIINTWNYFAVSKRQDGMLMGIWSFESEHGHKEEKRTPMPEIKKKEFNKPDIRDTIRFFMVEQDETGSEMMLSMDYIAALSREQALSYADHVFDAGKDRGYYENYRYNIFEKDGRRIALFLNSYRELQSIYTILFISFTAALISLAIIFILILFFSKKAIIPYMKNIELQKQFITDAGHELKTPITSISTSVDVLELEYGEDEWIANIRQQIKRMTKLTENLVMLSRFDEEQPVVNKQEFSLSDAIWEAAEPFCKIFDSRGLAFKQDIEDGLTLYGDRMMLQEMISVLMDNAFKYTNDFGKVAIKAYEKNRKIYIEVFNTCEDVSNIDFKRIFDRFYRPDDSRTNKTGGSGIGLSIARAAAEANGGKIHAESMDGQSIIFKIVFKI